MSQIFYRFSNYKFRLSFSKSKKTSLFNPCFHLKLLFLIALFSIHSGFCGETSPSFQNLNNLSIKLAGIIKIKPSLLKTSYEDLECSEEDRANICYIISCMGNRGALWLLKHKGELKEKGQKIQGVHPLKFLEVIFSDPELKSCMPVIFDSYFKRSSFVNGLTPNMTNELNQGKLEKYLKNFMKEIHLDLKHYKELMEIATTENWEEFVRFLFTH